MSFKPILVVAGEPNSVFLEIFFKSLKKKKYKTLNLHIMSKLLPSKTGSIITIIVERFRLKTYDNRNNILEFCRIQSIVFLNSDYDSDNSKNARGKVFALCKKLNIDYLQGFLFSKPMPANEINLLLNNYKKQLS